MSDTIKIQETSPDELQGGEAVLTQPERTGASNVDTMSFCRGQNVEAGSGNNGRAVSPNNANGAASRESASVSGMCVAGRAQEAARPVNFRSVQGSFPGDHRAPSKDTAAASLRSAADNGGPRSGMGQFPNGKNDKQSGFQSFTGDSADSDAGN